MDLPASLIDGVAKLAQLGGIGVGMAVFLFAFLLVWRGQPVDPGLAAFRMRALTLGAAFALVALLISLAQFTIGQGAPAGPGRMTVTFSPSFATENLPTPAMRLLDANGGAAVVEDTPFDVASGATLKISADNLIEQARSLQQVKATAQNLAASNGQLVAALTAAPVVTAVQPSAPASPHLIAPSELLKLRSAQIAITANLQRGNYAAAASTSNRLSQVVIGGQAFAVGAPQKQP
ncbi:hypothetical protein KZX46_04555 [Polymorphobacter sp. PAMC 29334]|uniref:hypothetical protein n=1 Tax=Polymorphobacter sp. PAMC 29334 TaxID=2862331 RepID=UPI001C774822|nr:hypothetical protein [Polymorphobacter sp. PAMC 29334]QYE35272.1 hypothetical protein KZX46_04555 [Polymorphobacter sp. PAMC 29334]